MANDGRKKNTYPGTKKRGNCWYYYLNVDGKKVWRGAYATQRDAADARAEAIVDRKRGRFRDIDQVTVAAYLVEHWLPTLPGRLKPTTVDSYAQKARVISRYLGSKRLQQVRPLDVQKMQQAMLDTGSSPRTVQYATAALSLAMAHARDVAGIIHDNPCERVKKPRGESRTIAVLTPSQMKALLRACEGSNWEAFVRLALFTGARRGELLALRWTDIDFEAATVTFGRNIVQVEGERLEQSTKTGRARTVTIDEATVSVLRLCRKRQIGKRMELGHYWQGTGEWVTANHDGSVMLPSAATQYWKRLCRKVGIEGIRLHDARHAHATILLAAGVPLHVVAARLGHKDAMVTATVYAHVLDSQAVDAGEAFAKAVG